MYNNASQVPELHARCRLHWTPNEDLQLAQLVQRYGPQNWSLIARQLNSDTARSQKSCRLRWMNHLDPGVKKEPFSTDEANIVVQKQREVGNRWSHIARFLPGRTDNAVKNFWYGHVHRRLRPPQSRGTEAQAPAAKAHRRTYNESPNRPQTIDLLGKRIPADTSASAIDQTVGSQQLTNANNKEAQRVHGSGGQCDALSATSGHTRCEKGSLSGSHSNLEEGIWGVLFRAAILKNVVSELTVHSGWDAESGGRLGDLAARFVCADHLGPGLDAATSSSD